MKYDKKFWVSVRYFLVQLVGYGIDVGGFFLFYKFFLLPPLISNAISKPLAAGFAFYFHRKFTFKVDDAKEIHRQLIRYIIVLLLNLWINSLILAVFLHFSMPVTVSKIAADIICVALTFVLMKHIVFRNSSRAING